MATDRPDDRLESERCPTCFSDYLEHPSAGEVRCRNCGDTFPIERVLVPLGRRKRVRRQRVTA